MSEQERYEGPERRSSSGDSEIVEHVKAADSFIELVRRWATFVAIIVGFGWTLKSNDAGIHDLQSAVAGQQRAIDDFKVEVRGRLDQVANSATSASATAHDLQLRYEQVSRDLIDERNNGKTRDLQLQKIGEWIEGQKALQSRGR